jgi:glutamine amidotransferase
MCLAIYKPADTKPDWGAYRNGMAENPDGWGFAVIDNGELLTACGMGGFADFHHNFEPFSHCQSIIHFRWATHGTKDETNCHPFFVKDLAVIHNGVIQIDTKSDAARSDTWHFVTKVVAPMYERDRDFFTHDDVIFNMELAHSTSKFVFLRQDGTVCIWNEEDGKHAADGHWYSNDGYLPSRQYWAQPSSKKAVANCTVPLRESWSMTDEEDEAMYRSWKEEEGYNESAYDKVYYEKIEHDLMSFGFGRDTVDEVFGLLGGYGLEALHDII